MRNIRTSLFWLQLSALAVAMTAGCVENDDKKGSAPPVEPAPVVPPEPARATLTLDPKIAYTVVTATGKCLQFGGGSREDQAQAEVATCNGSKVQQFNLQAVPGGYYAFINANSGKCLDVAAFAMGDNAQVQQYQCNAGSNQNWIVAQGAAGSVRIVARHSGKALSVLGGGAADAGIAKVTQLTAGNGANQQFKIKGPNEPEVASGEPAAGGRSGKGAKEAKEAKQGKEPKGKKGKATVSAQAAKKP